ncbi:MAG: hypothetical protein JJU13_20355 [Balneolaceae bacterium]|nr:hypothetical protein [Balneolaceae bacterium]
MKKGGLILGILTIVAACSDLPYAEMPEYNRMLPEEIDGLIDTGLTAWRTTASIEMGASCAGCHAPDALDLAYFDYNDFTLRRRGSEHVSRKIGELNASQLEDIVNLVHALRVKHNIEPKPNREFRPLQPAGEMLSGKGGSEIDKDEALAQFFANKGFRFASIPLLDHDEAILQKQEWLKLDVRQVPLGVSLTLWSEDPFYGTEHASLSDWLPALPVIPKPEYEEKWFELHNSYLRKPTNENLLSIFERMEDWTHLPFDGTGADLMKEKYKAMLLAQHDFRSEFTGVEPSGILLEGESGHGLARTFREIAERSCFHQTTAIELPAELLKRYGPEEQITEQMKGIHEKWLWKNWLTDPGSFYNNTDGDGACSKETGMTLHLAYRAAKSSMEAVFGSADPGMPFIPVVFPVMENPGPSSLLIIENSYRMFLHFLLDDLAINNRQISASEIELKKNAVMKMNSNFERFSSEFLEENRNLALGVINALDGL